MSNSKVYIRFGDVPKDIKITVSVYDTAENTNGVWCPLIPVPYTTPMLITMQKLLSSVQFENIPVYLVTGEEVRVDENGAIILKSVNIIKDISNDYGVVANIKDLGVLDCDCLPTRASKQIKWMLSNAQCDVRLIDFIFYMEALKCNEVIKPRGLGDYHLPRLIDVYHDKFVNAGEYYEEVSNAKSYVSEYITTPRKNSGTRNKYTVFELRYRKHLSDFKAKYGYK